MSSKRTEELKRLESLFIEKLTEKYKLTERDIKRAFCKFDKDNSGFLDIEELTTAIQQFLNGVDRRDVSELVSRYDIDGDGSISLVEFSRFLLSRNSPNKDDWVSIDQLTAPSSGDTCISTGRTRPVAEAIGRSRRCAEAYEEIDISDTGGPKTDAHVLYVAKIYLQNLRSALIKIVVDNRRSNKIPLSTRLEKTTSQLYEAQACNILNDAFRPYLHRVGNSGGVDFSSFCRVLHKYSYPGAQTPEDEVMEYLYLLCCVDPNNPGLGAHPQYLLDAMFEKPKSEVNKFGFVREAKTPLMATGRPTVGKGPLKQPERSEFKTSLEISDIPMRFVTKKCRTSLAAPSNFDMAMMDRSARLPSYDMTRHYIFGLNSNLNSGDSIYAVSNERSPASFRLLYTSAAVGVMHDLVSNTQSFFDGHTDDITCITLDKASSLVATGQTGKDPFVCIWDYIYCTTGGEFCGDHGYNILHSSGLVRKVGDGFFYRGVCSVCFSFDATYLCAIGCDDHHTLGLWHIETLNLLFSTPCHSGVPPQIKCLKWCPAPQHASYISKDAKGMMMASV